MPITFRIDHERRRVIAHPHGLLRDVETFNYQQDAWSRPDTCGYDELIDMSGVTRVEQASGASMSELARLSSQMDAPHSPSRLAIVATTDLHFGLARMYQMHSETVAGRTKLISVFRRADEALAWLDGGNAEVPA